MICDSHIHIGTFEDLYFDPLEIGKMLSELGIKSWAVSSTSACDEPFNQDKIIKELNIIKKAYPDKTKIVIWLIPGQEKDYDFIKKYEKNFFISAFKIHPYGQYWEDTQIRNVFSLCSEKNKPLLIHTGGNDESDPTRYTLFCRQFPDVKVILAHGRPFKSAETVLREYDNTYVDTAYMPLEDIKKFYLSEFKHRIFFGTDFPLDKHFFPIFL